MVDALVRGNVELDALADENGQIPEFTAWLYEGEHWNGWACPHFEKDEADRLLAAQKAAGFHGRYDPERLAPVRAQG